jgi:hypothetical protein
MCTLPHTLMNTCTSGKSPLESWSSIPESLESSVSTDRAILGYDDQQKDVANSEITNLFEPLFHILEMITSSTLSEHHSCTLAISQIRQKGEFFPVSLELHKACSSSLLKLKVSMFLDIFLISPRIKLYLCYITVSSNTQAKNVDSGEIARLGEIPWKLWFCL